MRRGENLKGKKKGGRSAGTPNKATAEKLEVARIEVENARGSGKKLAKEILEDFMHLFTRRAQAYAGAGVEILSGVKRMKKNDDKFLLYAKLAVDVARDLADFQSPKFRAIMVSAPGVPNQPMKDVTPGADNVHRINDPIAAARVYQQTVRRVG